MTTESAASLGLSGIVPIVTIHNSRQANRLADALVEGGIRCLEITLRSSAALDTISAIATRTDILVGAGTVLNAAQVDAAIDSGARFIVSPGLSPEVVQRSNDHRLAVVPGVATATEVQLALSMGLTHLKLFPAETLGGIGLVNALSGPFPQIRFMVSGGLTAANLPSYLSHPAVFAAGCSWIVIPGEDGNIDGPRIAKAAREAALSLTL